MRVEREGRPVLLGSYGNIDRAAGPIAVERNHLERAAHVFMQTEGRDIGSVATRSRGRPAARPATQNIDWSFVGQIAADADDVLRVSASRSGSRSWSCS